MVSFAPTPPRHVDRSPSQRHDGLGPGARRAVVLGIVALHGVGVYAALQVPAVRQALAEASPMFVSLVAPPQPVPPAPPPPPVPVSLPKKTTPAVPLITAAPAPAPAVFAAPPPEPEPAPPVAAVVAPAAPAPPAPPAPPPPPKNIPASAIQYLEPPAPEYPRLSRRLGEAGLVVVRVYVDEAGLPRSVQLAQSSGFARLDEAALAGVQRARFKPYSENGVPTAGWARIPIPFELER
jgi:periplasmic protein TonB